MAKSNKPGHIFNDVEDDFDDDFEDQFLEDDLNYLNLDSESEFEDYLDYRATRKSNRKGAGKRGGSADNSHPHLPNDWEEFQYG